MTISDGTLFGIPKADLPKIKKTRIKKRGRIELYTALLIAGKFDDDEDVVYLRHEDDMFEHIPSIILTMKKVKETYDLKRTLVINMRPYFCGGQYEGMLYTIRDGVKK